MINEYIFVKWSLYFYSELRNFEISHMNYSVLDFRQFIFFNKEVSKILPRCGFHSQFPRPRLNEQIKLYLFCKIQILPTYSRLVDSLQSVWACSLIVRLCGVRLCRSIALPPQVTSPQPKLRRPNIKVLLSRWLTLQLPERKSSSRVKKRVLVSRVLLVRFV